MSNDFIPFAVGGSANVTAQATYAANTTLTQNGFQSGIAKSPDLNKVWRQSSIMAAVLAQFIANTTGQNATDDGTTATLLANLVAAVSANSEATIGAARNLSMSVTAASATATMTADEIVVGSALGGLKYTLASFNKTINLATTGAGGMDTGAAPTSGYVALYAIYNPATGAAALLAQNASTLKANVYAGANMPAGYTASALVSVWPTNSSGQLIVGYQIGRRVCFAETVALSTSATAASFTSLSIASIVPPNARAINGNLTAGNSATGSSCNFYAASSSGGVSPKQITYPPSTIAGQNTTAPYSDLPLATAQTVFYKITVPGGAPVSTGLTINSYTF